MANGAIRITRDGIEGTSPEEIRANYVDVSKTGHQALVLLVAACLEAERRGFLPDSLKLPLHRVKTEFPVSDE